MRLASSLPTWEREDEFGGRVAGCDAVGRGALMGPIVAAAVLIRPEIAPCFVRDSKKVADQAERDELAAEIRARAEGVGVGFVSAQTIDRMGPHEAELCAMARALDDLWRNAMFDRAIIDGSFIPQGWAGRAVAIRNADASCGSVACASLVAKSLRDAMIIGFGGDADPYGWRSNKGYGTPAHLSALRRLGPHPEHRRAYKPVAQVIADRARPLNA